jgi:MFS family permease
MTIIGVASVIGPVFGGVIVQHFGWRWLLLITIPLTFCSALYAYKVLPQFSSDEGREHGKSSFDMKGSVLFSILMALIMIIMTNGNRFGWVSIQIIGGLSISLFLATLFAISQIKATSPLIDLQLLKRKYFILGSISGFFTFLSGTAVFFMMPFYLQGILGYSPSGAGLIMMPMAGCFALSGPISGWLSDHYGWRKIEIMGLFCVSISLLLLSFISAQSNVHLLLPLLGFVGLGMGLFYSPNSASILSVVEREKYSLATSFINVTRNYASIVGISLTTAVITTAMGTLGYEASLDAVREVSASHGVKNAFVGGLNLAFKVQVILITIAGIFTFLKGKAGSEQYAFEENSDS